MAANRMDQINELLRVQIAQEFITGVELPAGTIVTVTRVRTAPDLKHASVMITVLPDNLTGSTLTLIKKTLPEISRNVSQRVNLRKFPKLKVIIDGTERSAAHIEALLDSISDNQ